MAWPLARRVNDPRADPAMLAGRIAPKRQIQGELIKIKVYPIECI